MVTNVTVITKEYVRASEHREAPSALRDLHVNHCHNAFLYLLEPYRFATVRTMVQQHTHFRGHACSQSHVCTHVYFCVCMCTSVYPQVLGCSDCTIVIGAVGGMLRVLGCERVQIVSACRRLYISSCLESVFPVSGVAQNSSLIAPFSVCHASFNVDVFVIVY